MRRSIYLGAQHLLSLDEYGIEVGWIQGEDLPEFAVHPDEFMLEQFGGDVKQYLDRHLPFKQREALQNDIISLALGGYVVRLELNGKALAGQPGDVGHAVIVSGFNETAIRLENPDGQHGSKPQQVVPWSALGAAWDGYRTLQYYKNKS